VKEVRLIKIESILWDKLPINPSVLELVDFLRGGGKIPPIKLQLSSDGGYKLKDGRHRVAAFKLLGIREIEAKFSITKVCGHCYSFVPKN
jgi:ParB-like chromosome segregation protein Spo0J